MGNNSSHKSFDGNDNHNKNNPKRCHNPTKTPNNANHQTYLSVTPQTLDANSSFSLLTLTPITSNTNTQTPMKLLPLTSFPSTPNLSLLSSSSSKSYRSKLMKRVLSDGAAQIATYFWQQNVEQFSMKQRLEIACSIWFGMLLDAEIEDLVITRSKTREQIEITALKVLDMLGFIVRAVYTSSPDLSSALQKLGELHAKMGVDVAHYHIMLRNIHRTFRRKCFSKYTETVEFAMTEVFTYSVQLMTGQDIKTAVVEPLKDLSFLKSLHGCIRDPIGCEYLFKYLNNMYCDEMVVFLYLLLIFKSTDNQTKRQILAKQIAEHCIDFDGRFALNISYHYRSKILKDTAAMSKSDENLSIDVNFFIDVEDQICRLIQQNHWKNFKMCMKEMYFIQ